MNRTLTKATPIRYRIIAIKKVAADEIGIRRHYAEAKNLAGILTEQFQKWRQAA